MAVSTTNWFNNAFTGEIKTDVDIFESSTRPQHAVGTHITRSDGITYVYSHFGTAISHGALLLAPDRSESGIPHAFSTIYAAASATAIEGELRKPGKKGSHYVEIIRASVTKEQFSGGYFQLTKGDGTGYTYRVRDNTASGTKVTGGKTTFYLRLYEPLQSDISTAQNTVFRIVPCPWANLESAIAANTGTANVGDTLICGVSTCSHAANTYGWIQKNGIASIRTDASGTLCNGSMVALSQTLPGCITAHVRQTVATAAGATWFEKVIVGHCVESAVAAVIHPIAVQLRLM